MVKRKLSKGETNYYWVSMTFRQTSYLEYLFAPTCQIIPKTKTSSMYIWSMKWRLYLWLRGFHFPFKGALVFWPSAKRDQRLLVLWWAVIQYFGYTWSGDDDSSWYFGLSEVKKSRKWPSRTHTSSVKSCHRDSLLPEDATVRNISQYHRLNKPLAG